VKLILALPVLPAILVTSITADASPPYLPPVTPMQKRSIHLNQPRSPKALAVPDDAPAHRRKHRSHRHPQSSRAVADIVSANRAATLAPARHGFVNAEQIYPYATGIVFQVVSAPERVTDIALQPGEQLIAVASGDTVRWVIGDTTSGAGVEKRTHILVKPFAAGLSTNLVVTTDRRSYHIALNSTAGVAMAAMSWTYPQDALIAIRRAEAQSAAIAPVATGLEVDQLRFDYAITGDRPSWRPIRAFDDGRQTFIEFPVSLAVGEAPPLFLVDRNGEAQLVNYRLRGRYYVVDRLFDAAELRLGTKHQDVVRISHAVASAAGKRS
jgi:P-type conjugative transfer protein TrbG